LRRNVFVGGLKCLKKAWQMFNTVMFVLCYEDILQEAVLSQGGPRDAAALFDTYRILQRHRAVFLLQHGFPTSATVQMLKLHIVR